MLAPTNKKIHHLPSLIGKVATKGCRKGFQYDLLPDFLQGCILKIYRFQYYLLLITYYLLPINYYLKKKPLSHFVTAPLQVELNC